MSEKPSGREFSIPPALHVELVRLASAVMLKRAELEAAQLRQELAVRRVIEQVGALGEDAAIDLDVGVVRIGSIPGGRSSP